MRGNLHKDAPRALRGESYLRAVLFLFALSVMMGSLQAQSKSIVSLLHDTQLSHPYKKEHVRGRLNEADAVNHTHLENAATVTISARERGGSDDEPFAAPTRSLFWAGFQSFLLPGLGEVQIGRTEYAAFSLGSEALLWAGLISTALFASSLNSDARLFAQSRAGIAPGVRADKFWDDVLEFNSRLDYNNEMARLRLFGRFYSEADDWNWASNEERLQFRNQRIRADNAAQNQYYFIAGLGLNRLISIINAVRLTRLENQRLDTGFHLRSIDIEPQSVMHFSDGISLSLRFEF